MSTEANADETVIDYITGKKVPNMGAEANRQKVERFLVEEKGYAREDVDVDADIAFTVAGVPYSSQIDLAVSVENTKFMLLRCAAGSLGSWEREILAAARIFAEYQIPISVISDGKTAILLDTLSGKPLGKGLDAIPSKKEAMDRIKGMSFHPLPEKRKEKEKTLFRSYDSVRVNVQRNG
ncbi:type I restriction enzyme HsdR N-terminal domain-containing protein [Thermodesulfobacteriota bacterium]